MDPTAVIERSHVQQEAFADAARLSMHGQVLEMLRMRGCLDSPDLEPCPRCEERIILLAQASTWVRDRKTHERVCAPCGTRQAVLDLILPGGFELGGEGG